MAVKACRQTNRSTAPPDDGTSYGKIRRSILVAATADSCRSSVQNSAQSALIAAARWIASGVLIRDLAAAMSRGQRPRWSAGHDADRDSQRARRTVPTTGRLPHESATCGIPAVSRRKHRAVTRAKCSASALPKSSHESIRRPQEIDDDIAIEIDARHRTLFPASPLSERSRDLAPRLP